MKVLLVTSNGVGLGHLSRAAAIGLQLEKLGSQISVFSLSGAINVLSDTSWPLYHMPSFDYLRSIGRDHRISWHRSLYRRLLHLIRRDNIEVLIFDGVHPYRGLREAVAASGIRAVWIRRGLWKKEVQVSLNELESSFDFTIEPGDLAAEFDAGITAGRAVSFRSSPVVLESFALSTTKPTQPFPGKLTCLVQLGAGVIGSGTSLAHQACEALLLTTRYTPIVLYNPLNRSSSSFPRGTICLPQRFPLHSLYSQVDAAVLAAGYNSFHEALNVGVAAVFVPNEATQTDDQLARANWAASCGFALTSDESHVVEALRDLEDFAATSMDKRASLRGGARGAGEIARFLSDNV